MKRPLTLLFFLFSTTLLMSQKEAAIWYFGDKAGLDFNSGTPVVLTDGVINTGEGCATISDFNGDLLFYTDGVTVWNRNHQPMPNGLSLEGHSSSSQSAIIVPKPNVPDIYYIFTADFQATGGIFYSEVDMTLNGGLGDITNKNVPLIDPATEKLTAVQHANGRDVWVITHDWGNDAFLAYLVSPAGVNPIPVTSNVGISVYYPPYDNDVYYRAKGYLKASPDGSKLAICHSYLAAELLDFDDATGQVSNPLQLGVIGEDYYGAEFSPSNDILYITTENEELFQYDLTAADINASRTSISGLNVEVFGLQLAIDGKIYVAGFPNLGVINNPNVVGTACNYTHASLDVQPGVSYLGLPPFIQSYFLVSLTADNLCLGNTTEFHINVSEPITNILWNFGDGNTSTLESPTHIYSTSGDYTVSVTVSTASETRTESKVITISEIPTANPVTDIEVCSPIANYQFDLSTKDTEILGGQSSSLCTVEYYSSLVNAQASTNPLPVLYTNTNATETIFARISNINNPGCYETTSFELVVKEAPALNTVSDWVECDTDADGFFNFNLTQKDSEVLNSQSASTFSISYHLTQADADADLNALGTNYINTTSPETIFFRIANTTYPECYETGSFTLEVITAVIANTPTDMETCDDDNDGFFSFDLSTKDPEILGGQNPASFGVSYHASQGDTENGINPLNGNSYTNTIPYSQTLYARVQNNGNPDCYNTTSFELQVYDIPLARQITDWHICDDDNDGVQYFDLHQKDTEILGTMSASDFTISYFTTLSNADANTNGIIGPFLNTSNPQAIYYRIENNESTSCFLTGSFDLQIYESPTAYMPTPFIVCDTNETGVQIFDLSTKDIEVLNGQDANIFLVTYFATQTDADANQNALSKTAYSNSALQETIYVRIQNNGNANCYDTTSLELIINTLPQPQLEEIYVICPDSPELTIDGGDFESWVWHDDNDTEAGTTRFLDIGVLGAYTLSVTQTTNGVSCSKTVTFEVVSSGAPDDFTYDISGFSDTVSLTIDATGIGTFEYSVDGENYQESNRFELFPGEYTIFVRDEFLCRTISKNIIALGYQKFFTPNGDGINEYWNIIGVTSYPDSRLYIYDRYGKLLEQILPNEQGWDGTYQGNPMPSADYWFLYNLEEGKIFKGHFALKR